MSIVIYDYLNGAPNSYHLKQNEVLAENKNGELKYIGYYRGQDSVFKEELKNDDIKPSVVPDFVFNPTRNKCELRFDDRDKALLEYMETHPYKNFKYALYSEEKEFEAKLSKAESIEKALDYIKESDDTRMLALGLSVLGMTSYGKTPLTVKSLLKDKAINSPKLVIKACEDDLFENKFIASLALCSNVVKTNSTMTAIVWSDNNGRILNIATGEDFVTKFAQYISEKTPESQSILQEIGKRVELTKKKKENKNKEANRIAELEAKLAQAEQDLEISRGKEAVEVKTDEEISLEKMAILEVREKYKALLGKNAPFKNNNDIEWMHQKMDEYRLSNADKGEK
mgnify:CR=1 FL=1